MLGLVKPLSEYFCNCFFNISNSVGAIPYDALDIGVVPKIISLENPTALLGGSLDISSNTSENSFHTGVPFLCSAVAQSNWFSPGGLALSDELKSWLMRHSENHFLDSTVDHWMVSAEPSHT